MASCTAFARVVVAGKTFSFFLSFTKLNGFTAELGGHTVGQWRHSEKNGRQCYPALIGREKRVRLVEIALTDDVKVAIFCNCPTVLVTRPQGYVLCVLLAREIHQHSYTYSRLRE